jgi:hypothetical protein
MGLDGLQFSRAAALLLAPFAVIEVAHVFGLIYRSRVLSR